MALSQPCMTYLTGQLEPWPVNSAKTRSSSQCSGPLHHVVRHNSLHVELGYKVHCTAPYTGNQLDDAGEETCLITWEPKWEAADSFCHADHPAQVELAAEFAEDCDGLDTINMARDNYRRQDAHKSNLDKQGTWVERERRTEYPLAYKPQLRRYIHLDPNNTIAINPDQDIFADGTYMLG